MAEIAQYLGTGKRKTSVARVILRPGDGKTWINGRTLEDYFPRASHRTAALGPLQDRRCRGHVRPPRPGPRRRHQRPGRRGPSRDRPCARRGRPRASRGAEAGGLPHARRPPGGAQEGRPAQGAQGAAVLEAITTRPEGEAPFPPARDPRPVRAAINPMARTHSARTHFGTDGVRGIVGDTLTLDLVERLGRAATVWGGRGRVFVGRDTRGSGPALEEAVVAGITSAGGIAVLGGVLPTPAVALLAQDLGLVLSASHNPPEYNGVKLFDAEGHKLADEDEEAVEALLDAPAVGGGSVETAGDAVVGYVEHVAGALRHRPPRPSDRCRLRERCLLGDRARRLRAARRRRDDDRGHARRVEHQRRLRSDRSRLAAGGRPDRCATTSASPSTVTAIACSPSTRSGAALDGDQILAVLALDLGVDTVAVTTMTNLGFHRLMAEHGIRVLTTDVGDRHVLAALRASRGGARRRAVGSRDLAGRARDGRRAGRCAPSLPGARRPLPGRGSRGDAAAAAGETRTFRSPGRGCPPRSSPRWSGSTTSLRAGAGSSFAPPARSLSSAFSSRRRTSGKRRNCVVASPISSGSNRGRRQARPRLE